jgi:hypothetical protein
VCLLLPLVLADSKFKLCDLLDFFSFLLEFSSFRNNGFQSRKLPNVKIGQGALSLLPKEEDKHIRAQGSGQN